MIYTKSWWLLGGVAGWKGRQESPSWNAIMDSSRKCGEIIIYMFT